MRFCEKKIYSEKDLQKFEVKTKNYESYPEENFINLGEINDVNY